MTAYELCEQLRTMMNAGTAEVTEGTLSDVIPEIFPEALTEQFLAHNTDAITIALAEIKEDKKLDALVGPLEENAFLADFQNSFSFMRQGRITKAASGYSSDKSDGGDDGLVKVQLSPIGTKVEDEFLTKYLRVASTT